jgi:hypothetical protein
MGSSGRSTTKPQLELNWGEPKEAMVREEQEQNYVPECSLHARRGIGEETAVSDARSPWSNSWAQAQAEAQQIREMEERFSWMKEADKGMLSLGLEPYPWCQFAEVIERTGETEFMVFEQRGSGRDVYRESCPDGAEMVMGASLVVRTRTCVTALSVYSDFEVAAEATGNLFSQLAECLPVGAQVDIVVATDGTLAALGSCADILMKGLDIDQYCQEPNWKNLMENMKVKQIQANCRMEDAEGLDSENILFLNLALQEVRQAVMDVIQIWLEGPAEDDQ